jgi:hypothetical protein
MRRLTCELTTNRKYLNMKKLSLVSALVLGGLVACSITANAQECPGGKKATRVRANVLNGILKRCVQVAEWSQLGRVHF